MTTYAELELTIRRNGDNSYAADLRFVRAAGETDDRLLNSSASISFDFNSLGSPAVDKDAYAKALTSSVFQSRDLRSAFYRAREKSQEAGGRLRFRLFIDLAARELHSLCWELLQDPETNNPLFTGEQILFSRYLSSSDSREITLRSRSELKALVVIANPENLKNRGFTPVKVDEELQRAKTSLKGVAITALAENGQVTLSNLVSKLREGYDVLYLVCHGAFCDGQAWLWMETPDGDNRIPANDFVARLSDLVEPPRLVVLASCQSAGEADRKPGETLAALGPQLAEASGIPAIVAMQGKITVDTVASFMPTFFRELLIDGQIDRAVAVARGAAWDANRTDYWMPVLFTRLRKGKIWNEGFGDNPEAFEKWPAIVKRIYAEPCKCTPILGSGLTESLIGSSRQIAQRWAETYHFPMAPSDREDLPNVAQYLAATQDDEFPRSELGEYLKKEILRRFPSAPADCKLDRLLQWVGAQRRKIDPAEPHRVLASLPFRIYITTNPDTLLEDALTEAGRPPESEICRWNSDLEMLQSVFDEHPDYVPDANRPLVFHLFGSLSHPDSVVLTEDDYFDYLIGITNNRDLIPGEVRKALANSVLLFLGFQIDDWDFRILFRSIMRKNSGNGRSEMSKKSDRDYSPFIYEHVAAQIDLEQGRILDPQRARRYLEKYFQASKISIYWGSSQDFIGELAKRSLAAVAAAG